MVPTLTQIVASPRLLGLRRWGAAHPFLFYTAPLLIWIVFITWASLTTPNNLPEFHIPFADKFEHGTCYAILAVLMLRGWLRGGRPTFAACLFVALLAPAWGLYMEFMQRLSGYRTFDWFDELANTSGVLLGLLAWLALWFGYKVRELP